MFNVGDKIVHPMHGAGVIDRIVEKKIDGDCKNYYVLEIPVGGILVMIPTATSDVIGVRPVCDFDTAERLMEDMGNIEIDTTENWNRRYRENMLRIKSGNLLEVAKVVKSLIKRDNEKGLSTGERKMLHSAKQILISELVLSQSKSYEEVEARINAALA